MSEAIQASAVARPASWRRRLLTMAVLLVVPTALAGLAVRAYINEDAYATMERPSGLGTFVPEGYYDVVNREVAPHLAFCPTDIQNARILRPELAALLFQTATGQLPASKRDANPCTKPCATGRLSPLFCLRTKGLATDRAAQIQRFVQISPLKRDLHVLQRWRRAPAKGTDHAVALVHGERRQALPTGERTRGFSGRVLYRDSAPMLSLIDEVGNEYLFGGQPSAGQPSAGTPSTGSAAKSGQQPLAESIPFPRMLAARDAVIKGGPPRQTILRGGLLEVTLGNGELRVIAPGGDAKQVIVEVPQQSTGGGSTLAASIDGADLGSHSKRRLVGLEDGQQLQLTDAARTRTLTLRFMRRQSAVLSGRQTHGQRRQRKHDPEAGLGRYLDALTGGVSEAGRRLEQARSHCNKDTGPVDQLLRSDVRLTLDQRLQHTAQGALAHYARVGPITRGREISRAHSGRYEGLWMRARGRGQTLTPPPVMSLTILDADQGELLAMASYPSRDALAAMEAQVANTPATQPGQLLIEQLRRSAVSGSLQLKPHVIGSLFKPLMAWGFGVSDPALLEVPVPRAHRQDWPRDPTKASTVEQCLVPKGVTQSSRGKVSRFHSALRFRPIGAGCGGKKIASQDTADVCAAIGGSSTYWFLHLGARGMLKAMGAPFSPTDATPDVYAALDRACAPRRHKGLDGRTSELCTAPKQGSSAAWFPTRCVNDNNPFCAVARLFDVQVQAIGGANPVTTGPSFLGPLFTRIERLGAEMDERCVHIEQWRSERNSGLLWALPRAPQWPQDLINACAHATMVIQGGFVNYWGSVALAQAMARVATGRRIEARLVQEVVEPPAIGAAVDAPVLRHVAKPKPPAALGPARCATGDPAPLCKVREGMRLAVSQPGGTLHGLIATERQLNREAKGRGLPSVRLLGKTGSGGEFRPRFVYRRRPGTKTSSWQTASGRTASVHTALIVTFTDPTGTRQRTFVVYIWAEGIDQAFTSTTGAAPFFQRKGTRPTRRSSRLTQDMPGLNVLRALRGHVQAHWPAVTTTATTTTRPRTRSN